MNIVFRTTAIAAALLAGGIATNASAATATGTFTVSLTVNKTCAVSGVSNITLPAVTAGAAPQATATAGAFTVKCSNNTAYTVGLIPGNGTGGNGGTGNLSGTTAGNTGTTIAYALYQNSNGSTAWGNSPGTNTQSGTGNGVAGSGKVFTPYANFTGSSDVQPDTYTDTVQINVVY